MILKWFSYIVSGRRSPGQTCVVAGGLVIAILTGCASQTVPVAPEADAKRPDADELLVTDCLLPGQVRKLGQNFTYLAPRRAIKTTVSDCEIRGGEYVAYDRANYATALKVWLPQAKAGDPTAQTYVGEIYEKGLGIQPDYAVAAQWYRKAAAQGYARAQIDLGYLYERGLGVEKDLVEALNWYRQASGLTDGELEFASSVEVATRAAQKQELQDLRQEVEERKRQSEAMQRRLQELERQLDQRKKTLALAQTDLEQLRVQLEAKRHVPANVSNNAADTSPEAQHQATAAELETTRRQLAELEADADQQRNALAGKLQAAQEQQQRLLDQVNQQRQQAKMLRQELAEAEEQLAERRDALKEAQRERDEIQAELERLRAADATAEVEREIQRLSQRLSERETVVEQQRQEMVWLENEIDEQHTQLSAELDEAQAREQQLEQTLKARAEEVDALQSALEKTQAELRKLNATQQRSEQEIAQASAQATQQVSDLEQQLRQREQEVKRQEQAIEALQASLAKERAEFSAINDAQVESATAAISPTIEMIGPSIEIIEPPLAVTRGVPSVTLRAPVSEIEVIGRVSASEELLTFRINDQPESITTDGVFRVSLPVKGQETPVSVVAVDESGRRASIDFLLIPEATQDEATPAETTAEKVTAKPVAVDFGRYHALLIGNQEYLHLPNLSTAINDAKAVARILRDRYGFNTQVLLNADRYSMLSALNELRETLTDKDNLLIYYAGHGELDETNLRGHWLPIDAEPESTANWISNVAVTDILNVMAAKHVLVVADSCYSGAMTRTSLARLPSGMSNQARVKWFKAMSKTRTRAVLTSGGLEPVLDAGGGEHSVFAKAFLEVLNDNDEILEGWRLFREVRDRVRQVAFAYRMEQEPQYAPIRHAGHEAGEFLFLPSGVAAASELPPRGIMFRKPPKLSATMTNTVGLPTASF